MLIFQGVNFRNWIKLKPTGYGKKYLFEENAITKYWGYPIGFAAFQYGLMILGYRFWGVACWLWRFPEPLQNSRQLLTTRFIHKFCQLLMCFMHGISIISTDIHPKFKYSSPMGHLSFDFKVLLNFNLEMFLCFHKKLIWEKNKDEHHLDVPGS